MVKCLKIQKARGETARRFLEEKGWLDKSRLLGKTEKRYLIIPMTEDAKEKEIKKKFAGVKFENKNLHLVPPRAGNLKHLLKDILTEKQSDKIVSGYDIVGDIVILEIPKSLDRLDKSIAWAFKRAHPYVRVVAKKVGKVGDAHGVYRIRNLEILTGENRLHTIHTEDGIPMKLDLSKVYFSPRLSHERLRIANLVKKNEKVLVMFAGIGAYGLTIAKKHPISKVWMIELNPDAIKYMEENIRLNHLSNVISIEGDVSEVIPKIGEKFDRIISILPEKAWDYLYLIFHAALPNAIAHFYVFRHENELESAFEKIKIEAKKNGRKVKIINWVRSGAYSPHVYRWCIEFKIL